MGQGVSARRRGCLAAPSPLAGEVPRSGGGGQSDDLILKLFEPGSYELVIKGIKEFHVLSPAADWDGARKLCDETALLLPTSGDFNRLLTFYPPPVRDDLPDVPVWGDVLGAGTAFTLDLYSGVIGAEDMATLLQVAGIKP